jgi:hypothetical protein
MDKDSYRMAIRKFLDNCIKIDVITQIPKGSGVFHIANILPNQFDKAWISQNAGRFSEEGEKVKYYADKFDVCAKELGYPLGTTPSNVVFVAAEITEDTSVFDVHKLPINLQSELYEDKNSVTKYEKSHVLMETVREDSRFKDIKGTYYPSASGQVLGTGGSCLALFDQPIPTNIIGSGDYSWWKSLYSAS